MAESVRVTQLGRLLAATARAHHGETGGTNDQWASWYAARLAGDIDSHVGFSPSVDIIEGWLTVASERHHAEAPESHWPFYYAELILDTIEESANS
jgi:hypothetical protein